MDITLMAAGFKVMLIGLGGVFAVLILFYITTKIMLAISKKLTEKKSADAGKA